MFNDEDDDWVMGSTFQESYQCLPATDLLLKSLREAVEFGGKVVMPGSALETLSRLNVSYPLMFEVENDETSQVTHCGVLEFSAPEGTIYLPAWMMKSIGISSGDIVTLRNVTLMLGRFVKLQPQSVAFLDITDPRAVLEHSFRSFSALTKGDLIQISYNDTIYELMIKEVKPENTRHAISIVETDLQVDFEAPVGYVEPTYQRQDKSLASSLSTSISNAPLVSPSGTSSFKPFSGAGNKLKEGTTTNTSSSKTPQGPTALKLPPGTLFFGNIAKPKSEDEKKPEVPGFKAFSGSGNKLR